MTLRRRIAGLFSRSVQHQRPRSTRRAPRYAPEVDGEPDPGEVVWAGCPTRTTRARARTGRSWSSPPDADGDGWVGLMLSSQDHDRDAADEARHGRHWMDVGTGGWDSQGRPSEVRLDRLIRLRRDDVRREGPRWTRRSSRDVVAAVRGLSR